ncbi:MAG: nucleotidyltransferase domain-containing protein [Bacteroidetes bacterium]|nr:nucleotidyltransferase domain-containing protein [Bacteroidota bacterium]
MFTRKAIRIYIQDFIEELKQLGYQPEKIALFGSYAYGRPHELSDIDLAVWDKKFSGCGSVDVEPIAAILSKFPFLELHPFSLDDTPETNPLVGEILKRGITIQ